MTRLVEDLLSLSRIEMNEHSPPTEDVAISGVLTSAAEPLERAPRRGACHPLDARRIAPCGRRQRRTDQVFQNLLDNAIKYGAEGTPIEVVVPRSNRILTGARPAKQPAWRWRSATTGRASRASICRG